MQKWRQQFSIGYFVIALILLFAVQTFFASPHVETITCSQFKTLAKKGLLSNVVIGEKVIRGEIKPEGLKKVLPAKRLKALNEQNKEAKTSLPFTVVRVEDPELISDLEKGGVQFKGEVTNDWLATVLSWVVLVVLFFLLWNYLFKRSDFVEMFVGVGAARVRDLFSHARSMLPASSLSMSWTP
jgi:cell division protease FtsH